ncbi:MAG: hypothetical protein MUE73_05410 [Planctomycetes bacterium]|nr:hypothetical protein [Planctomycetota bacterium]
MADTKLEQGIREIVRKDPRFAPNAYYFMFEALEFTLSRLDARRHVSGKELLEGVRDHALQCYGYLARTVLYEWGITTTEHIGEIVFHLVRASLLLKNDSDTLADFRNGFDFTDALESGFLRRERWSTLELS